MPTYSRDRLPYNLLKKQYLRPGENAYTYSNNLAAWIRARSATSKNYGVSTINGGVVQNEFAPTRFQFPAFYVNEGSAGGGPEFRITHTSNFSDTFSPKNNLVISLWLKPEEYFHSDASSNGSNILCITDGSTGKRITEIFLTEAGSNEPQAGIRVYDKTHQTAGSVRFVEAVTTRRVSKNKWHHFVFYLPGGDNIYPTDNYQNNGLSSPFLYVNGINASISSLSFSQEAINNPAPPAIASINIGHSSNSVIVKFGNGGGSSSPGTSTVKNAYMNGYIADVAIYNECNNLPDLAPFLYKLSVLGAFQEQSGFLNNPERIMRNTLDERSYWPSTIKGGDQRRLGNAAIKWDDYKLPEYTTKQVSYPSMLHRNDSLLTSSIYQTYVDGQLNAVTGSRTIPRYAYDMFYEREEEVTLSPFEDSRVYIDQSSDFYLSGSDIPGFTGSLAGKDVVVMEFELDSNTLFGSNRFSTSGSHSPPREMKFMGYYNPSQKNITFLDGITEPPSTLTTTYFDSQFLARSNFVNNELFTSAAIGFAPMPESLSYDESLSFYDDGFKLYPGLYYSGSGHPIDNFGFPSDDRYKASDSNTISFSNYSAKPFLVEKLIIDLPDIDAHLASTQNNLYPYDKYTHNRGTIFLSQALDWQYSFNSMNFFVLKQRGSYVTGSSASLSRIQRSQQNLYVDKFPSSGPPNIHFHTEIPISSNTNRDLLFNASIGFTHGVGSGSNSTHTNEIFANGNFGNYFDFFTTNYIGSGSIGLEVDTAGKPHPIISARDIRCELESEVYTSADQTTLLQIVAPTDNGAGKMTDKTTGIALKWNLGLRNNTDKFSNIDISNSVSTTKGIQTIFSDAGGPFKGKNVDYTIPGDKKSPVIIFPEDDIIIGFQSQIPFSFFQGNFYGITPAIGSKIYSGSIKIQLFGSYIENSKPKLPMLNQSHGYTEAVHGAIGEISIHDQFDISYRQEFSGSNPDTFMGIATFFPGTPAGVDGNDIFEGVPERDGITAYHNMTGSEHFGVDAMNRSRGGLASDGTVGIYDSLKRNYRLEETNIYDKDSVTLNVKEIWNADNTPYPNSSNKIGIGDHDDQYNNIWSFAFPFEDRYDSVNRSFKKLDSSNIGDDSRAVKFDQETADKFILYSGAGFHKSNGMIHSLSPQSLFPHLENLVGYNQRLNHMIIFGIGDGRGGLHNVVYSTSRKINYPRGAKYGLSNFYPTSRSAVFRRTSYGQFRDMLEPRLYGPTLDSNLTQIDDPIVSRVLISNGAVEFLDAADSIIGNKDENYRVKTPFFDISEVPVTISPVNINNIVTTVIDSL